MELNITVDQVDLTSVIGTTARYDQDGDRVETDMTLGDAVAAKLAKQLQRDEEWPGLRRRFVELRDEEIREQLKPIITDAINGPIQKTNSYGEPVGQTTTLRELIVAEVQKNKGTHLSALIRESVDKALRTELAEAIAAEKAKVVAAVRAKAADLIADAVKQGIGTR